MEHTVVNSIGKRASTTTPQKDTRYTKIFVGGLPYHTTDDSLRGHFLCFGEIEEAVVITDRHTGKSKGYGFVTMTDQEAAERACKDSNPIIDGRKSNVNLAYIGAKPRHQPGVLVPGLRSFPNGYLPASSFAAHHPVIYQSPATGQYITPTQSAILLPSSYPTPYISDLVGNPALTHSYASAFSGYPLLQALPPLAVPSVGGAAATLPIQSGHVTAGWSSVPQYSQTELTCAPIAICGAEPALTTHQPELATNKL